MIRPANPFDLPALLDLGERMHAESPRFSRLTFSSARLHNTLRSLLDNPAGFLWVAEQGVVIGGMAGIIGPHWASDDLVATDLALFIDEKQRGGMSTARLVTEYKRWAHQRGARIVQVGVTTGVQTEQTARLYERLGLARCGLILEA
ncbi:GNAT family N-acetyltransferase [Hydrogenophaga sp.]|uniref:GNAT family N-acetyltransferase n=1 Tax=Hydrogenophaga sp. TaxID=1904254 RepID=UPI003F70B053